MPPAATVQKKLERVLDEALELAELGNHAFSAHRIAETIYETEKELIAELSRSWMIERLAWMISRRRRARWNDKRDSGQMVLPDPIFQGLPKRIFVRNGQRPKLDDATLGETRAHLTLLRERLKNHWRVKQFEAVVDLHRKWEAVDRGIKWVDAKRREAEWREKQ